MSKKISSDVLIDLTHDEESLEKIKINEQIKVLESIIEHPKKMSRKLYAASEFYDNSGNFDPNHMEYQIAGTLLLSNIPLALIYGGTIAMGLIGKAHIPDKLITAGAMIFLGEAAVLKATGAYMSKKGTSITHKVKDNLIKNLQTNGYEVTLPEDDKKLNFTVLLLSLIKKVQRHNYPNSQEDYKKLKDLYKRWINISGDYLADRGTKIPVPQYLLSEYHTLYADITNKIKMYRYEDNNQKLLTQEKKGNIESKYVHLIEEDEFVKNISNLIEEILSLNYEGFADDIESLKQLATEWIALNVKSLRDNGTRLSPTEVPFSTYNEIAYRVSLHNKKVLKK